ncbi:LuxR C-terminal-related transcriptional regulator [Streptomyces sp. NBC_01445]|uniref:LuxR C-terminal-related transcriptional regulator n=1 Tax=Streptomyces sp. NBC_01445 TaxID=2903869 RepID=UPI002DDB3A73|nr:LuxR C-terminal-related transcriptional regulator [Streptomyces sp. NBC_01445]WSE11662.1 LuxR C-terminal-related transcriptional regulator [Streptomyces sp. NBC_01445]
MEFSSRSSTSPTTGAPLLSVRSAGEIVPVLCPDGFEVGGGPRVVEVVADRWAGKSTVLDGLSAALAGRGWTVAAGAASPARSRAPFGVFVEALEELVEHLDPDRLGGRGRDHAAQLAALFPALSPDAPRATSVDTYRICRAMRALLEMLVADGPLLLALDDVHWMDADSLELLGQLLEQPVAGPVVIAVAHRGRPGDRVLNGLLARCASRGGCLRVRPAPLTEQEAIALLPDDLSRVHCETLLVESGGSPGLLRAFATLRQVPGLTGAWTPPLPADLLADVLRDFRALSAEGWQVVRAAAVLHEPYAADDLKEIAHVDDAALWRALDELIHEELLRPDELPWQLRFANPLLRVAAYQSAGRGWLLGAHAQAARILARPGYPSAHMARHLERGAALRDESGARVLWDAAARLLWQDPAQSVSWIRAALASRAGGDLEPRDRLLFGKALALAGRLTESLATLGPFGQGGVEAGLRVERVRWRAHAHRLLGHTDRAQDELESLLAELEPGEEGLRDVVRHALIELALHARRPVPPRPGGGEPGMPQGATGALRGRLLAQLAVAACRGGEQERADQRALTARQLLDTAPDGEVAEQLEGLYWLATAEAALGRPSAACGHYERGLRIAETRRLIDHVPLFAMALSALQLHTGDGAGAARHAACAETVAAATESEHLRERALRLRRETASGAGVAVLPGQRQPADAAAVALEGLSRRESEVALLVSGGRTNQQIARVLELSHKTVETYLGRIFQKLQVQSRAEVAAMVGRSDRLGVAAGS